MLSVLAAAQAIRLWDWRPGIPLSLESDSPQVLVQIQSILDGDWYTVNTHVGAPFAVNQAWFTTADVINFSGIKLLGLFTDSPATAGAVFFILGFPAAALSSYWLARTLKLSRPAAVVTGVLFAVLPGHQLWFNHLWLAAYWMVPLAAWLIMATARGDALWPHVSDLRQAGVLGRRARWAAARTVFIVLAVGLSDVYYVAFTLILMAIVLFLRLGTGSRAIRLAPGALATGAIGALCGLSLFVATRGRGAEQVTGALPAARVVGESEIYAGKIIDLILPWYEHRASGLRFLTSAYGIATTPSVERPALGVVALFGVGAIVWVCLTSLMLGRKPVPLVGLLAALTLVSVAFYTRGGLGSVVALFFTPQIRTWSRFVVLIALFGLLSVGIWLTHLGQRRGRRVAWFAAGLVILVGVLDQTNPGVAPKYAALRSQQAQLTSFTHTIADRVGKQCSVFQLPVVAYPEEPPPGTMGDYDHLLPSLTSPSSLSWSYGAIRGTSAADWQLALPLRDQRRLLEDLAAAGFCAVEIDHDGYTGATDPGAATQAVLGPTIAQEKDANLSAYDLRGLQTTLRDSLGAGAVDERRQQVLKPVVASVTGSLVDTSGTQPFQWAGPSSTMTISNMGVKPVTVSLSVEISGVGALTRTVTATVLGQPSIVLSASNERTASLVVSLKVPHGSTHIDLETTGASATVPGTEGRTTAALRLANMRLSAPAGHNVASLQQFAGASPSSLR